MTIAKIGILGAGTMGGGIAINAAQHGIEVVLVDVNAPALEAARGAARKFYARAVEKGRMSEAEAAAAEARIATASGLEAFAEVDLVLEAVFEDFDLKARLFGQMKALLKPGTLVATNTSCLRVSDLAEHVGEPELFLGMHYFSPAQVNPLVEVVRGPKTADAVVERVLAFCRATGKKPLLCKDNYGFAVNRFFCPYTNEASRLVDEGLGTTAQIDRVAQGELKIAAGPFFVQNIIKPRINLHAIRNLGLLGAFYAPAALLTRLGEADEPFEIGEPPAADPAAERVIAERLMAAMFLPVLEALDEEIASPADIDMGAEVALKFGRPPCKLMDELGRAEVERLVAPLCATYGHALPKAIARVGSLRA